MYSPDEHEISPSSAFLRVANLSATLVKSCLNSSSSDLAWIAAKLRRPLFFFFSVLAESEAAVSAADFLLSHNASLRFASSEESVQSETSSSFGGSRVAPRPDVAPERSDAAARASNGQAARATSSRYHDWGLC